MAGDLDVDLHVVAPGLDLAGGGEVAAAAGGGVIDSADDRTVDQANRDAVDKDAEEGLIDACSAARCRR